MSRQFALLLHQLEPHRAFELSGRLAAGARIELALAGLAQMPRSERGSGLGFEVFPTALFYEDTLDRCLSVIGRQAFACPAVAPEARGEKVAQQIGLVAVLAVAAGVADEADAAQRSAVIDQGRDRDGKTVGHGAGIRRTCGA